MGRTVGDTALMLDAMAGWHIEDPLSLESPRESFQAAAAAKRRPKRIGFSPDLGIVPVDAEVREICAAAARRFQDLGAAVEEACPDFTGAIDSFKTLRAAGFVAGYAALYDTQRDKLKPDVIWNIEQGMKLDAERIGRAQLRRSRLYGETVAFLRQYDLILAPSACCPPGPIGERWVREVDGHVFSDYVGWLTLHGVTTLTACPAIAIPAGFTADGSPVGIQLVGSPRGEADLLSAAAAIEEILGVAEQVPIDPQPARPL
jgi:amidase